MRNTKKIISIILAAGLVLSGIAIPKSPAVFSETSDTTQVSGITVTPDPSLAPADARKDMAHLFCTTQSKEGVSSKNISQNNYTVWGNAINSFLEENEDGSFLRVELIDSKLVVEKYSADFQQVEQVKILSLPLPLYGGYFKGKDARYLVCGDNNSEESDDKEVIRVIKYDLNWTELSHLSIYGANTYIPFSAGSLEMTEMNGTLYIHGCHTMYGSEDGKHHQSNMSFAIDEETMEIITHQTAVRDDKSGRGYVSHSFCQRITHDDENIYILDHGDGYPRSVYLQKLDDKLRKKLGDLHVMEMTGDIGRNSTGVSIGNIVVNGDKIFTAGNSVEQFGELFNPDTDMRNIWVSVVDKNLNTDQKYIWLTDLEAKGSWNARTPYVLPASGGGCYVLWQEDNITEVDLGAYGFMRIDINCSLTKIAKIRSDGTVDGKIHTIFGSLSPCKPIITSENEMVWYTTDNASPKFYRLALDQLDSYEFAGFANIQKCSVVIESDSYMYKNPGKEKPKLGPGVISVLYGDYKLTEGIDYEVAYSHNDQPGTGYIEITGKGIFNDPTDTGSDQKMRIPYQVNYPIATPSVSPTMPAKTSKPAATDIAPSPEDTPYREPSWFKTSAPAKTKAPTAGNKPASTKKPSASPKATAKPTVKQTKEPGKITLPTKNNTAGSSSTSLKLKKVGIVKVNNLKGKRIKIYWEKQKAASGYQIQYALNKSFTKNKKNISCSKYRYMKIINQVKKNKIYYIRIRAYNMKNGSKIYGKWSKVQKCKIRK